MVKRRTSLLGYSIQIDLPAAEAIERLRQVTEGCSQNLGSAKQAVFKGKIDGDTFSSLRVARYAKMRPPWISGEVRAESVTSSVLELRFRFPFEQRVLAPLLFAGYWCLSISSLVHTSLSSPASFLAGVWRILVCETFIPQFAIVFSFMIFQMANVDAALKHFEKALG